MTHEEKTDAALAHLTNKLNRLEQGKPEQSPLAVRVNLEVDTSGIKSAVDEAIAIIEKAYAEMFERMKATTEVLRDG